MIYLAFALICILLASGYTMYRIGRKTQKGDDLNAKLDAIDEGYKISDRYNHDAEFRERLRDRFDG